MAEIQPIRQKWKGTMTDRDRFNAQMHYRPIDRTFHMEFGYWDENFTEWEMFRKNGIRSNGEADVFFQFDRLCVIGGSWWMEPPFPYQVVEETADTRIIMNGDGLLAEVPRDAHDTIPHFLKATVCTPDDWKRVKAERFRPEGRVIDVEALKKAHPADRDYPLGVDVGSMIGKIRDMLTFEGLCYAMYDYPAMVEDMVETCCVLVEQTLDQLLPHFDFDFASGWEDICFKNAFCGPAAKNENKRQEDSEGFLKFPFSPWQPVRAWYTIGRAPLLCETIGRFFRRRVMIFPKADILSPGKNFFFHKLFSPRRHLTYRSLVKRPGKMERMTQDDSAV